MSQEHLGCTAALVLVARLVSHGDGFVDDDFKVSVHPEMLRLLSFDLLLLQGLVLVLPQASLAFGSLAYIAKGGDSALNTAPHQVKLTRRAVGDIRSIIVRE